MGEGAQNIQINSRNLSQYISRTIFPVMDGAYRNVWAKEVAEEGTWIGNA